MVVGVPADAVQPVEPSERLANGAGGTAATPPQLRFERGPGGVGGLALGGQLGPELPDTADISGGETAFLLQLVDESLEGDLQPCVVLGGGGVAIRGDLFGGRETEQGQQDREGEDQNPQQPGADAGGGFCCVVH